MSITSFDLGEYQRRLAERVAQTRTERAAALATMPEFAAFLDALRDAGMPAAHVAVSNESIELEWGTPTKDREPPGDIIPVSTLNAAIAAGKVVLMQQRVRSKRT
jgi:hypothetical protein